MTTTLTRFREIAATQIAPVRVDAEKGILYDVLMLGTTSKNRADYPLQVMQQACALYEGQPCYVGHTRDGNNPEYDRKLGVFKNVHVAQDGLRGDLHFNPKHHLAEQLVWDAVNAPTSCGFSHDCDASYDVTADGRKRVSSIHRVYSIDLVTRPGSTSGLFSESEQAEAIVVLAEPPVAHASRFFGDGTTADGRFFAH